MEVETEGQWPTVFIFTLKHAPVLVPAQRGWWAGEAVGKVCMTAGLKVSDFSLMFLLPFQALSLNKYHEEHSSQLLSWEQIQKHNIYIL